MKKIYKKLSEEQAKRGVIFSSCLSTERAEQTGDNIHEVIKVKQEDFKEYRDFYKALEEQNETISRLKDDKFFNDSPFKFNIIRTF